MLEDLQSLLSTEEAETRVPEDETLALEASQREIQTLLQELDDRELAQSFREVDLTHTKAIAKTLVPEMQAVRDHALLLQMSGLDVCVLPFYNSTLMAIEAVAAELPSPVINASTASDETFVRLKSVLQETEALYEQIVCVSCEENHSLHDVFVTQCNHAYCKVCVVELVWHTIRDEALYPMRCCKSSLPMERLQKWISPDLLKLFKEKCIEYESTDRVYCADPSCSKFITSDNVDRAMQVATCSTCSKATCTLCNKASHGIQECPQDSTVTLLLEVAKANGWKRCYSCHAMIGISTGCNHMK